MIGNLETLSAWMEGSFSSAAQAADDPEHFRDIRLHMAVVWKKRKDGPWLYVEQAAAATPDKPYRQRMYRLSKGSMKGTIESAVFELPGDPLVFAGAWKSPELLDGVRPEDLTERRGCAIVLRFEEGAFRGSTEGTECVSTLRGAAYVTSEVVIEESRLMSWDRGFDADGMQKWGAETGGYVFVKE
ncbi:MAG: chromophore lyase CpcT/CpeT [Phycisphaerae bacterium]|nr:chromophore lyase CpcT/CpeT [Phycisphaerae bacterium]